MTDTVLALRGSSPNLVQLATGPRGAKGAIKARGRDGVDHDFVATGAIPFNGLKVDADGVHAGHVLVTEFPDVDPTGATDSTAGIQAGLATLPPGSLVKVPAGTYSILDLQLVQAVTLEAIGDVTFVLPVLPAGEDHNCIWIKADGCALRGITFEGQRSLQTTDGWSDAWLNGSNRGRGYRPLVKVYNGTDGVLINGCAIEDCRFQNANSCGVASRGVQGWSFKRNTWDNLAQEILFATTNFGAYPNFQTFTGCHIEDNKGSNIGTGDGVVNSDGMVLDALVNFVCRGNEFTNVERNGIKFEFCHDGDVSANVCDTNTISGFDGFQFQSDAVGLRIRSNKVKNCGCGIGLRTSISSLVGIQKCTVEGNTIENTLGDHAGGGTGDGISVHGLPNVAMAGNPNLTFAAAGGTVTRSAGSWVTEGFRVGFKATITNSASNNVALVSVTAVSATVLTLDATLVDEGPVGGVTVIGGTTDSGVSVANNVMKGVRRIGVYCISIDNLSIKGNVSSGINNGFGAGVFCEASRPVKGLTIVGNTLDAGGLGVPLVGGQIGVDGTLAAWGDVQIGVNTCRTGYVNSPGVRVTTGVSGTIGSNLTDGFIQTLSATCHIGEDNHADGGIVGDWTLVTTTPFTPSPHQRKLAVRLDTIGPATIQLPPALQGQDFLIRDARGDADMNPIEIIVGSGGTLFDRSGSSITELNTRWGQKHFRYAPTGTESYYDVFDREPGRTREHLVSGNFEPAYQNSWIPGLVSPSFSRGADDSVILIGQVHKAGGLASSGVPEIVFTLPAGYTPGGTYTFVNAFGDGTSAPSGVVIVRPSGDVLVSGPAGLADFELSNVRFQAASSENVRTPLSFTGLVAVVGAHWISDVTLTGGKVSKIANHAGSGGTAWDLTDGGNAARRCGYNTGYSFVFDGTAWLDAVGTLVTQPCTFLAKARFSSTGPGTMVLTDAASAPHLRKIYLSSPVNGQILVNSISAGQSAAYGDLPFHVEVVFDGTNNLIQVPPLDTVTGGIATADGSGWTMGARGGGGSDSAGRIMVGDVMWMAMLDRRLRAFEVAEFRAMMP